MEYILNLLSEWLIKQKAIKSSERELYEYAIYSFLISFIPLVIFLIASGAIGMLLEGMLIIFPFMIIRKFSGGYHAKYACVCLIVSTGLLGICLYGAIHSSNSWILHALSVVAGISITINSPIDSDNRKLTKIEIKRYKYITCLIVAVMLLIYITLGIFQIERYSICIADSLILTALLQMPYI